MLAGVMEAQGPEGGAVKAEYSTCDGISHSTWTYIHQYKQELEWHLILLQAKWNTGSLAFEISTNMDDTSPRSSRAAVSTWLPSYLQAFVSASFVVLIIMVLKASAYIYVVGNTQKNLFMFAEHVFSLDYYNSEPPGGAQNVAERSALPSINITLTCQRFVI